MDPLRLFKRMGVWSVVLLGLSAALVALAQTEVADDASLLKIRSGIVKTWEKPFYLEEDDLRRIYKELEQASRELTDKTRVVFGVIREDDRFYETTRIEDVLSDPNSPERFVQYMRIELRIVEPEKVRDPWESTYYAYVEFQRRGKPKAKITVSHPDRNWSLLLSDALEAQVVRTLHNKRTPGWLVVAFVLSVYALGYRLKAITDKNDFAKFIHRSVYNPIVFGMAFGFLLSASKGIVQSDLYIKLFGPECGFMWGECANILAEMESLRSSVFWVVVVGLPLSVIGSLTAALLTAKGHEPAKTKTAEPTTEPYGGSAGVP